MGESFVCVLSIIGALAWLPIVISFLLNVFRKIHFVYLDKHFIYNAEIHIKNNGTETIKTGMAFLMALNIFVYNQPFFAKKIVCKLTLKNGAKHESTLFVGGLGYSDTQVPPQNHQFVFPEECDMNYHRSIFANQDNVRVLPFFFENLNMNNDENIAQIAIVLHGRFLRKTMVMENNDCAREPFFPKYDKIVR